MNELIVENNNVATPGRFKNHLRFWMSFTILMDSSMIAVKR